MWLQEPKLAEMYVSAALLAAFDMQLDVGETHLLPPINDGKRVAARADLESPANSV
jgi:hypothetical protein